MNMNVILSALGDILGSKMLIIACKGINFTLRSLSNYPLGVNLDWGSLLTKLPYHIDSITHLLHVSATMM